MFKLSRGYGITRLQIGPWVWFWKNSHFQAYQSATVVPISERQLLLEEAPGSVKWPAQEEINRLARHSRPRKRKSAAA